MKVRIVLAAGLLACMGIAGQPLPALAAGNTYNVNGTGDGPAASCTSSGAGTFDCPTLRDAVYTLDSQPLGAPTATISLPAGTYTLTQAGRDEYCALTGSLDLHRNVTIQGAGSGSTIIEAGTTSSNGIDRIFDTYDHSPTDTCSANPGTLSVSIDGVTLQNGYVPSGTNFDDAGAFYADNNVSLTLTNSVVAYNQAVVGNAGAIEGNVSSTFSFINDTFDHNTAPINGGAVYNSGKLTIEHSTFTNNQAGTGGAIYDSENAGTTSTIVDSSFTSNNTIGSGTVGQQAGDGGALASLTDGELDLARDTFASNTASYNGGGVFFADSAGGGNVGKLVVTNSTLTANTATNRGGAVANGDATASEAGTNQEPAGSLAMTNDTIDANAAAQGGGVWIGARDTSVAATATTAINNTILTGNSGSGLDCFSDASYPVGSSSANLVSGATACSGLMATVGDPQLGSLQNNGGPTPTQMPASTSPGLRAANQSLCPATDQRNYARHAYSCDIGAVEFYPFAPGTAAGSPPALGSNPTVLGTDLLLTDTSSLGATLGPPNTFPDGHSNARGYALFGHTAPGSIDTFCAAGITCPTVTLTDLCSSVITHAPGPRLGAGVTVTNDGQGDQAGSATAVTSGVCAATNTLALSVEGLSATESTVVFYLANTTANPTDGCFSIADLRAPSPDICLTLPAGQGAFLEYVLGGAAGGTLSTLYEHPDSTHSHGNIPLGGVFFTTTSPTVATLSHLSIHTVHGLHTVRWQGMRAGMHFDLYAGGVKLDRRPVTSTSRRYTFSTRHSLHGLRIVAVR